MKKNQLIGFAVFTVFIFGLTIFPVLVNIKMHSNEIFSKSYSGTIKEIYNNNKIIQIFLNNNTNFDFGMDDLDLDTMIAVGDSVYKSENNQEFYFFRKDTTSTEYRFLLSRNRN